MTVPNYQEITDKFSDVLVTLHSSIRNMEKLKVNSSFLAEVSQNYTELVNISDQINRLIKENPDFASQVSLSMGPKKF